MTSARELAAEHDAAGRHEEAINALAVAAHHGDVDSMAELSKRLIAGDRAPYLPVQGAGLLAEAAGGGSVAAMLCLACLTALGAHVQQSWSGALGWLVRAAELGSEPARGQLRVLSRCVAGASSVEYWGDLGRGIDLESWLSTPAGRTLHEAPRVRHLPNFIEPALCDWLIARAHAWLRPAMVYRGGTGDTVDEMRTNSVAVWSLARMDLINVVVQYRIAAACAMPLDHLEAPTTLRYRVGEQITNHYDYINTKAPHHDHEIATRGERVITFLTYLNDDYDGGATDFPVINVRHQGQRGDGLSFANALPSHAPDDRALHAGLPPTRGEKWVLSQFVRSKAVFNTPAENAA